MDDLTSTLRTLFLRNRDGSHATQADRLKRFARDTIFHLKLRQELATYNATVT